MAVAAGIILGAAHVAQGQFAPAERAYEKGFEAARTVDYRRVVHLAFDSLGTLALLGRRVSDAHSYFLDSLKITFESGQSREQLGSLRDIATVYNLQGKLEKAVELLAVVLHHPARQQNSLTRQESLKDEAERLRAEIERLLRVEQYHSAWKRGKSMDLGDVVAGLIMDNQEAMTSECNPILSSIR